MFTASISRPRPFEHRASGIVGAAALHVEADFLAGELADVRDLSRSDDVELVVEQPGDVGDVTVGICNALVLAQLVEGVGAHEPEINSLEEADVICVLPRALAEDRQDAQVIAVVEDEGHVARHPEIGPARRARDDRDCVGVHALAERRLGHRRGLRSGLSRADARLLGWIGVTALWLRTCPPDTPCFDGPGVESCAAAAAMLHET